MVLGKHILLNQNAINMAKKNVWRTILEVLGAVVSALLGALGGATLS